MLLTPAQIKPKSFESRRNSFFTRGGCASCLRACLGARLLPQSYQYPKLSEGADRVAGQLRGDKECPFSGVTKTSRVWRKVPESDAWSVTSVLSSRVMAARRVINSSLASGEDRISEWERVRKGLSAPFLHWASCWQGHSPLGNEPDE